MDKLADALAASSVVVLREARVAEIGASSDCLWSWYPLFALVWVRCTSVNLPERDPKNVVHNHKFGKIARNMLRT